ncbi:MAG: hypothetical protein V7K24_33530 [Nostoc sp.]
MRANAQAMSAMGNSWRRCANAYAPLLSSKNWVGEAIAPPSSKYHS